MAICLNEKDTLAMYKAIEFVLKTNNKNKVPDVVELSKVIMHDSQNAVNDIASSQNINYTTLIAVLENFCFSLKPVEIKEKVVSFSDLQRQNKTQKSEILSAYEHYYEDVFELKERIISELSVPPNQPNHDNP